MIDTRLNWVTYFSPNPEKVAIVSPQNIEADAIKTLLNHCGEKGQPKIVQHVNSSASFSPLSQTQLDKLDCDSVVYLLQSRESFKSIKRKINSTCDCTIEEYSVFPGWRNPRWFVPLERSLWLGKMSRMIQPSRFVAKVAVAIFRFLKVFGKAHYLFPCRLIVAHNNKISFLNFFEGLGASVRTGIVYTGSFGPLQKFTVELLRDNDTLFAYAKFGHSELARQAIQKERRALNYLTTLSLSKVVTPEIINASLPETLDGRMLIIKNLEGGKPLQQVTSTVVSCLADLFLATQDISSISIKEYTNNLQRSLRELDCSDIDKEYNKIRNDIVAILHNIAARNDSSTMLPLSFIHGDFTRWNVRADDKKIYAIDWEEAAMRPPGYDLLSFILKEILAVQQTNPEQAASRIIKEVVSGTLNVYLDKVRTIAWPPNISNSLLTILFFAEVVRSTLWHIELHNRHHYPEKKSLSIYIKAAWIGCVQLSNEIYQ